MMCFSFFQVIDRQLYFTSVEVFVLVCVLLLCRRRGKTSVTDMPPEVRRLLERVPVAMDVSHSPRRNSYTEGASRKQNKMLTVGTSLQKHSSDTSLGTRMRIIIVDWNFFMYSKFIYLFHSYACRLYTCTILQWYCNCYMVYLATFDCEYIYIYCIPMYTCVHTLYT